MIKQEHFLLFLSIFILTNFVSIQDAFAQNSPQKINYQAVARDSAGQELSGANLEVEFSIFEGATGATLVYAEIHTDVITDPFGLFTLQIGSGVAIQGDFSQIDWSENAWLNVNIDAGNGMIDLGMYELISVPYALYASQADSANYGADEDADPNNEIQSLGIELDNLPNVTINLEGSNPISFSIADADADSTNEIQNLILSGTTLSLSNDDSGTQVDLSTFNSDDQALSIDTSDPQNVEISLENSTPVSFSIEDADADTENELQSLNIDGNTLSLSDDPNSTQVDLSTFNTDSQGLSINDADPQNVVISLDNSLPVNFSIEDADANASNEIQVLSKTGNVVSLSNGGQSFTDEVDDADADETNELITDVGFNSSNNNLTITEAGVGTSIDLSDLKADENWNQNGQNISNSNSGSVGINETNPSSTLHIMGSTAVKVRVEGPSGINYQLGEETVFIGKPDVGDVEVDLPIAADVPGRIYIIKKGDPSIFNDLKIHAIGSDKIEGQSTYILGNVSGVYEQIMIVSDGVSDWWIISSE
jgi:hypothetical protein